MNENKQILNNLKDFEIKLKKYKQENKELKKRLREFESVDSTSVDEPKDLIFDSLIINKSKIQ